MRILESVRWFVLIPCYPSMPFSDRFRLAYYYLKSLINRFALKTRPSNHRISILFAGEPLYFRDNWFDPRSVYTAFSNDYTALDRDIFRGISTFVDVGANMGLISRCARRASPGCKIVCFEPLKENAELCKLNNPGVVVETLGVGSKEGKTKLLVDGSGFMASSLKFGYHQAEREVGVVTLDAYFSKASDFGSIDLIKIDVEGMEAEVLRGGKKTIQRAKKVVVEIHSKNLMKEACAIMADFGFKETDPLFREGEVSVVIWTNLR
jgi:FkbM family methyltransferase